MSTIIYPEQSYKIMGACFEVYKEKGCGFLEAVFQAQPSLTLEYKGRQLKQTYAPDFVCYDRIILEIKAVTALNDEHRAQVHNYLRATGHRLGLLVNFGHYPKVETERIAL
jgi:GxxExxY protein